MSAVEVRFAVECGIEDVDQAEIESVLRRIPVGQEVGYWQESVHAVEVVRRLSGGRSGSEVLDIRVHRDDSNQPQRFVAKLGSIKAASAEWAAFHLHLKEDKALLLKIKAVTTGALGRASGLPGDREAVVYQHISDFAGEPDAVARTLEDVVAQAFEGGGDAAVDAIDKLMRQAQSVLYHGVKPDGHARMRNLNRQLGADLVVQVDNVTEAGQLRYRHPQPADLRECRQYPSTIRRSACAVAPEPPLIRAGEQIWLPLNGIESRDGRWIGMADDDVALEIRADREVLLDELAGTQPVDLHGRVVTTRAARWWEQLTAILPSLGPDQDGAVLDGIRIGHPLRHLDRLLSDDWVSSLVHGDLNSRNILLVNDLLCLIDYAMTTTGKPLLSDPAWLEISLLRDVIASRLTRTELVRLQRLLGIASRLPAAAVPARIDAVLADSSERFALAFRILWAVRRGARNAYPSGGRGTWWREYLGALTLGVCRTFKWLDDGQDPDAVAAAVITAGVAAEQLGPDSPFAKWSPAELVTLTAAFAKEGRLGDEAVLADLVLAVDALDTNVRPAGLTETMDAARAELTRAHCAEAARRLLPRLRRGRGPFIPLRAHIGQGPDVDALITITDLPTASLIGDAGSGKTTVLSEVRYQLAATVADDPDRTGVPARMPILVNAADLIRAMGEQTTDPGDVLYRMCGFADLLGREEFLALLAIGAFHVLADGFDELSAEDCERFVRWLRALRPRYPRAPLVVCQRTARYRPDVFDFPIVHLHQVGPAEAAAYVEAALRARSLPAGGELDERLIHSPDYRQLRELTCTPLFLWMIVEWYASQRRVPTTIGELFTEFTGWYLAEQHHPEEERGPQRFGIETKRQVLQVIACDLVERGNITELPLADAIRLCADLTVPVDEVLAEIVGCEMLRREGDRLRFLHQLFQEYFAACALADDGRDALARRVLAFGWREPLRILVSTPTTAPDIVEFVLRRAIDTDPRYGGWLLRAAKSVPPGLLESFVDHQVAALRSAATGDYGWHRAASGLAVLGTEPALDALAGVAVDATAPASARAEVLDVLLDAHHTMPAVISSLRTSVASVLASDTPEPVRISALRATAKAGLTANIGAVWDLIRPENPWRVVNSAYRTLSDLEATLIPAIHERYVAASEQWLSQVEQDLLTTVRTQDIERLQDDRFTILTAFADSGRLPDLLVRRFGFGLADRPGWSTLLATAAAHPGLVTSPLARMITEPATDVTRQSWRQAFADGDDLTMAAAAHRLLTDGSVPPEDLLALVTPDSSAPRLLAAAALAESAGVVESTAALARGLIERVDATCPELLEPLAALVSALNSTGHPQRLMVAHHASAVLQERQVQQAMYWPWAPAWHDTTVDDADVADLLRQGQDGAAVVANCLSSTDFLVIAGARPHELFLSQTARSQLHALRPGSPHGPEASRFTMTIAYAGLTELLPYVQSVALSEQNQTTLIRHANSEYGVLDIALASHAVSAIGYLGRILADSHVGDGRQEYRFLLGLDTTGLHPSIGHARLVGLGFLGDWQHIMDQLTAAPALRDAAENIVAHWVPGPFTPPDQGPAEIAEWIGGRLTRPDLAAPVRSTLERIKVGLESVAGHYVGAGAAG